MRQGSAAAAPGLTSTRHVPSRASMPRSAKISTMSRCERPPAMGARSRSNIATRVGAGLVMVEAKSSKLGRLISGTPRAMTAGTVARGGGLLQAPEERGDPVRRGRAGAFRTGRSGTRRRLAARDRKARPHEDEAGQKPAHRSHGEARCRGDHGRSILDPAASKKRAGGVPGEGRRANSHGWRDQHARARDGPPGCLPSPPPLPRWLSGYGGRAASASESRAFRCARARGCVPRSSRWPAWRCSSGSSGHGWPARSHVRGTRRSLRASPVRSPGSRWPGR